MSDHPPSELLAAYDAFLSGAPITAGGEALARAVSLAACFAAAAYDNATPMGHANHALARSFLLALINPAHPDLDYLRADPATGAAARNAATRLRQIQGETP